MQSPMRSIFILAIICAAISQCNGFNCNCGKLVVHVDRATNETKVIKQENCTYSSAGFMGTDFNGRCFVRIDYLSCLDTAGQCAASEKYVIVNFNKVEDGEEELSTIQGKKASLSSYSNNGQQFTVISSCTAEMCFGNISNLVVNDWNLKGLTQFDFLKLALSKLTQFLPLVNSNLPVLQTTKLRATTSTSLNTAQRAAGKGAGQANVDSQASAGGSDDGKGEGLWPYVAGFLMFVTIVLIVVIVLLVYCFRCKKGSEKKDGNKDKKKNKKKKGKKGSDTGNDTTTGGSTGKSQKGDVKDAPAPDPRNQPDPEDPFKLADQPPQ